MWRSQMVVEQKITFNESEVIDLYLVRVEKNDDFMEKMLTTKDLNEMKECIKKISQTLRAIGISRD